ncbi:MAG: hypothetical protein GX299_05730 [Epulopiscium sp.]|nr:hypothetical protein [Candidatus Epulonipiscium sp.]
MERKRHYEHTALGIFVFLALAIYLAGYIVAFLNRPSIPVETVAYGNIDTPVSLQGIIVREEQMVSSKSSGKLSYFYSENEKVKKGSAVCTIRNESTANAIEDKIEKIDKNILKTQKSKSDLSPFQDDITRIEKNILKVVESYQGKFLKGEFSNIYPFRNQIDVAIGQRNDIWMAENAQSLSELSAQKQKFEAQLAKNVTTITAKEGGILSFQVDKLEDSITPEKIDSITKEQTKMNTEVMTLSRTKMVEAEEPIFKLVTNNQWDIVSYVPADIASSWEVGDSKILQAMVGEEQKSVSVTITSLDKTEKEVRVVFHSTKGILDFIGLRNISFTVQSEALQGIKVPKDAIIEKTLLKLPIQCIVEENGEEGVIKMSGKKGTFVKLTVTKYDEEQGFAYVIQDFNLLKVGEVILQELDDKNQVEYTVTDVSTYKGVYIANSSIARFRMVDVLGENIDYAIIRPGTSAYELQPYDTIVSDAKKIEEGQVLY